MRHFVSILIETYSQLVLIQSIAKEDCDSHCIIKGEPDEDEDDDDGGDEGKGKGKSRGESELEDNEGRKLKDDDEQNSTDGSEGSKNVTSKPLQSKPLTYHEQKEKNIAELKRRLEELNIEKLPKKKEGKKVENTCDHTGVAAEVVEQR